MTDTTAPRTIRTMQVTLLGSPVTHTLTVEPYGAVSAEVREGDYLLGTIGEYEGGMASAQPGAARHGFYRFASTEAALAALVSYRARGYWTDEV